MPHVLHLRRNLVAGIAPLGTLILFHLLQFLLVLFGRRDVEAVSCPHTTPGRELRQRVVALLALSQRPARARKHDVTEVDVSLNERLHAVPPPIGAR